MIDPTKLKPMHITGSISKRDPSNIKLYAADGNAYTAFTEKATVIDFIEGRCDWSDYDPDVHTNVFLILYPSDSWREYKDTGVDVSDAFLIDLDFSQCVFCSVLRHERGNVKQKEAASC